jgi:hypothetical protein
LRKLIGLIVKVVSFVKATPGQKLEVRYRHGLGLELREQVGDVASVLPNDLTARWTDQGSRAKTTGASLGKGSVDGAVGLEPASAESGVGFNEINNDVSDDDEYDWDKKKDYTACSMQSCKYCGFCSY